MATDRITWARTSPYITLVLEADYIGQNIEGNYSILDCWIRCINTGGTTTNNASNGNHWGSIDGVGTFAHHHAQPWLPGGVGMNVVRWRKGGTVHVPHNADGSRGPAVVRMRAAYNFNNGTHTDTNAAHNISLPTIPRATTPLFRIGSTTVTEFDAGITNLTISLPRASSNFTHEVTYSFLGLTGTISTNAGVSVAWEPPMSLLTKLPTKLDGTGSITVKTKNGSTTIGTKTLNFKLKVPASAKPNITSIDHEDLTSLVKTNIGAYVRGHSVLKVTAVVSHANNPGATTKENRITVGSAVFNSGGSVTLGTSGAISAVVEDSRGRMDNASTTVTTLAYTDPQINTFSVIRTDSSNVASPSGTRLRLTLNTSVQSLIVGTTQKNAHLIQVFTRVRGTTNWMPRNVIDRGSVLTYSGTVTITGGDIYSASTAYEIRVEVSDKVRPSPIFQQFSITTETAIVDATSTKQAFGKMVEDLGPVSQIQGPAQVYGALAVDGAITSEGVNVRRVATTGVTGISELATNAEVQAGTDTTRVVTPSGLASRTATESRTGMAELATQAEVSAGTDTTRIVTPKGVRDRTYAAWAEAAGVVDNTASISSGTGRTLTVTLPSGRFTQAPVVVAQNNGAARLTVSLLSVTTTSFQVRQDNWSGGNASGQTGIAWHAKQMTSGSASG